MRKDTIEKLSPITVMLHWIIGIAVIAMLVMGIYIHDFLPRGPEKWELLSLHKSIGILILIVAAVRILWRFYNGMPKPIAPPPTWQKILAHSVHGLLLLATLAMPISGIMMTLGNGFPLALFGTEIIAAGEKNPNIAATAHTIHAIGSKVLIGLIIIHLLAAIKHQFIDKNAIVKRMLGCRA